MTQPFYDLLGVHADATTDEIRRAYRQRIKETHPDLNDDPDASEDTARLVEARDVLTDSEERARYDRIGHDAYVGNEGAYTTAGPSPWESGSEAEDSRSASEDSGPADSRASARERRQRERAAESTVDGARTSRGSGDGTRAARESSNGGASASSTVGETSGSTVGGSTGTTEPPPWSDTSDGWAARSPTRPAPGLATQMLTALREAPATALVTFLLYPLLVFGAFLPDFPLAVNLIVAACLVAMIAASQTVAGLGVAVYGTWSLVATVGLVVAAQSPFSPLGLIVLGTTWLPLGFSVLTYQVLDT